MRERRVFGAGHFERKQGDTKGTHTMLWLALADFDNSTVSNEEVGSTLSWMPGRCRAREFARRLGGYSVRVQLRREDCEIGASWTIRGFPHIGLGAGPSEDSHTLGWSHHSVRNQTVRKSINPEIII